MTDAAVAQTDAANAEQAVQALQGALSALQVEARQDLEAARAEHRGMYLYHDAGTPY